MHKSPGLIFLIQRPEIQRHKVVCFHPAETQLYNRHGAQYKENGILEWRKYCLIR